MSESALEGEKRSIGEGGGQHSYSALMSREWCIGGLLSVKEEAGGASAARACGARAAAAAEARGRATRRRRDGAWASPEGRRTWGERAHRMKE